MIFPKERASTQWMRAGWNADCYNYLARAFDKLLNAQTYQIMQKGVDGEPTADWVRAVEGEPEVES